MFFADESNAFVIHNNKDSKISCIRTDEFNTSKGELLSTGEICEYMFR